MIPRRIPDYPDAFYGWNLISSFGSIISVVATALFVYIIYDILANGKPVDANPWQLPGYFQSTPMFWMESAGTGANSLEWSLDSPIPLHAYNVLPAQSLCLSPTLLFHAQKGT